MSSTAPDVINQGSPGHVLSLVRTGAANTRPELARITGMSRSAVAMRVETLIQAGLLVEDGSTVSTGGRPAGFLRFADDAGAILVADLGIDRSQLGITDLAGNILAHEVANEHLANDAERFLDAAADQLAALLQATGHSLGAIRGVGVGLPGPVEHATGRAIAPPSMPGWDGFPVAAQLQERFGVPVLVDNDVNIMAWGEYTSRWRHEVSDLLFVKVAEAGIGCGIVVSGRIHRGAEGSAGAIGHIRVSGYEDCVCRCGNVGCLGAAVDGEAMARRMQEKGHDVANGTEVARLARSGGIDAIHEVRACGRAIGEVVAALVNFLNPEVVVVGGVVAEAHEQVLAGLREVVYQRCLPLATRHLRLAPSRTEEASIVGAAAMTIDHVMAPSAIDARLTGAAASA
jgi:predicted NBD/HSP70 family sugar kinase